MYKRQCHNITYNRIFDFNAHSVSIQAYYIKYNRIYIFFLYSHQFGRHLLFFKIIMSLFGRHLLFLYISTFCKKHANIHFCVFILFLLILLTCVNHTIIIVLTIHTWYLLIRSYLFVVGPGFRLGVNVDWNGPWNKDTNISQHWKSTSVYFFPFLHQIFYYSTMASWTTKTKMAAVTYISYLLITNNHIIFLLFIKLHLSLLIGPVSYTHLDVYKRQTVPIISCVFIIVRPVFNASNLLS